MTVFPVKYKQKVCGTGKKLSQTKEKQKENKNKTKKINKIKEKY